MSKTIRRAFREKVNQRRGLLLPGAANALAALVIADMGYEAVYLSGAGLTNTLLGLPDLGFVSLPEIAQHTAAIRDVVDIPIVVDADTGFGNALNVQHTVRVLERAGASAIQLEDQISPKRCGHFTGKALIASDEMVGKIRAAVDARVDEDMMVIARTDARAVEGFQGAIDRAGLYAEAGADILFIEAPESLDEILSLPRLVSSPQLINIVVGGRTPAVPRDRLAESGFSLVLYANVALQGALYGMQKALGKLKEEGLLDESAPVASFKERQRLVGKARFDELEQRYR